MLFGFDVNDLHKAQHRGIPFITITDGLITVGPNKGLKVTKTMSPDNWLIWYHDKRCGGKILTNSVTFHSELPKSDLTYHADDRRLIDDLESLLVTREVRYEKICGETY